jgi:hypothetical protein
LNPQVVVNLLPKLGVGVDLVKHSRFLLSRAARLYETV